MLATLLVPPSVTLVNCVETSPVAHHSNFLTQTLWPNFDRIVYWTNYRNCPLTSLLPWHH